ncbi:MAG: hypothetical protein ACE15C_02970 [Phycisphaerae bacterium]
MARSIAAGWLVAALTTVAAADQLVLNDGRTFTGSVKIDGDTVVITTSNATLSFPRDQVLRIEEKLTPEEELARKLADVSQTDAAGLFQAAQWAATNGLDKQAQDLCAKILQLSPDHAGAHRMLGQVKIDGQWLAFAKAVEVARGKLDAEDGDAVLKDIVPALMDVASGKDRIQAVRELQGLAQLRNKDYPAAAKTFAALGESAEAPAAVRFQAIADILKENADGMYVVSESFPATASVLGADKPLLKAGPSSLSDPNVLQAAIRDRAKKEIDAGRKLMDAAAKVEPTDPEAAKVKCLQALQNFDRADALVDQISRSYRLEIVRRRIAAMRKDADADADRFDKALAKFGTKTVSPQEQQNMMLNLIRLLDNVRDNLKNIVTAAKPYPRDLVLELKWAELDLKKLEAMRKFLLDELNGAK